MVVISFCYYPIITLQHFLTNVRNDECKKSGEKFFSKTLDKFFFMGYNIIR